MPWVLSKSLLPNTTHIKLLTIIAVERANEEEDKKLLKIKSYENVQEEWFGK